jgi:hypothetical protein
MYSKPAVPHSIGGVLDDAVRLYRDSLKNILPLLIINAILATVPSFVIGLYEPAAGAQPAEQTRALLHLITAPGIWIGFLVLSLMNLTVYGALLASIDRIATGGKMGVGEALQLGLARLPRLFAVSFLFVIALIVGFLLLFIPGLYLMGIYQLVFVAVVVEQAGISEAFGTSRRLIKGYWWRSSIIVTVAIIIFVVLSILANVVAGILAALKPGGGTVLIVNQLVSLLVNIVVVGWMPCVLLAMYYDLKLRHEGGDLSARVDALAVR